MSTPLPPIYRDWRRLLLHTEQMVMRFAPLQAPDGSRVRAVQTGYLHHGTRRSEITQWVDVFRQTSNHVLQFYPRKIMIHAQSTTKRPLHFSRTQAQKAKHFLRLCLGFAACIPSAHAACPSWPTAERFTINAAEVTDKRTGLVWARCSAGQSWSVSTCSGNAATYTHEGALQYAQSQSGWRLPNVKELASLADKGCQSPAIDSTAFPGTPSNWYWTSSPYVGDSVNSWGVDFSYGHVGGSPRYGYNNYYQVRLVRASQ